MQKIAIVGGGISGLICAHHLSQKYDITLFEEKSYLGGHSYTHHIQENDHQIEIDLGFLLFNQRGYPNFIELLKKLNVPLHKSDLSFSYSSKHYLEYFGSQLGNPFTPRINLFNRKSYQLFLDIRRFNHLASKWIESEPADMDIETFVRTHGFGPLFVNAYLLPTLNTLLSISKKNAPTVSSRFVLRYLLNNGLLENFFKPPWYFLKGGALAYLKPLCEPFKDKVQLGTNISSIERDKYHITITHDQGPARYDKLILGVRADQALKSLLNPSPLEEHLLSSIVYNKRNIFLHTDKSLMPSKSRLWAGLNYKDNGGSVLTYHANRVQNFKSKKDYFITVCEGSPISVNKVIKKSALYRPVISVEARKNQKRLAEINGILNTYYCGSYWGHGTHEDAVISAQAICDKLL